MPQQRALWATLRRSRPDLGETARSRWTPMALGRALRPETAGDSELAALYDPGEMASRL